MEKKVSKTNVSGSRFEDLDTSGMQQIQGQGAAVPNSDLVTIPIKTVTMTIKGTIVLTNSGIER